MQTIAGHIQEGAMAFLNREYRVLAIFVVVVAALLAFGNANLENSSWLIGVSFVLGAVCSGLAGYFGMRIATLANVRTTSAARTSLNKALGVAFSGGAVMGMVVVGLGVLGLSILYIVYQKMYGEAWGIDRILQVISGFSLGASSIALFARVGGGIYTKAADVGADLVGKVEAGIPEDDPRNPAVIADNVGDNVGDVAGMGADLFESYVGSIVGSMILGVAFLPGNLNAVVLPLVLAAVGIVVSIVGTFFVRTKEGGNPQAALNIGTFGAGAIMVVASFFVIRQMLPADTYLGVFIATVVGLAGGIAIGVITEYYTAEDKKPAQGIAKQKRDGCGHEHHRRPGPGHEVHRVADHRAGHRHSGRLQVRGAVRHRDRRAGHALDDRHPAGRRRLRADRRQRRRNQRDGPVSAPRCARAPTSWTPWATPPRPSARASRSVRPR